MNPLVRRLILLTALVSGCNNIALENRPCPCATGWQCCEGANVCVAEGTQCPASLTVTPATAHLSPLQVVRFSAAGSDRVRWRVEEADGGRIDANGLYRPPLKAGTYHLVATDESGLQATAEAVVTPLSVELVAGQLGGEGDADGVGSDARFRKGFQIAADEHGDLIIGDGYLLRKLERKSGLVSTLATTRYRIGMLAVGGDAAYYYGGGSQAPLARVSLTTGVEETILPYVSVRAFAADGQGHLYLINHCRRPSARTCCFFSSLKTFTPAGGPCPPRPRQRLGAPATTGRFSGVPHWPVLGVHRGAIWPIRAATHGRPQPDRRRRGRLS